MPEHAFGVALKHPGTKNGSWDGLGMGPWVLMKNATFYDV